MPITLRRDEGDFEIWIAPEGGGAGMCIGVGKTLEEAQLDATSELNGAMSDVDALADEDVDIDDEPWIRRTAR